VVHRVRSQFRRKPALVSIGTDPLGHAGFQELIGVLSEPTVYGTVQRQGRDIRVRVQTTALHWLSPGFPPNIQH